MYKRDYASRMNVMEEIFEIRSCIEFLANDIKIYKTVLQLSRWKWTEVEADLLVMHTTRIARIVAKKQKPQRINKTKENIHTAINSGKCIYNPSISLIQAIKNI